jgi:hypothetical protein
LTDHVKAPKCYFCDYTRAGAFVLITEVIDFGVPPLLPLRHRIFDKPLLEQQKRFVKAGCAVHLAMWGGGVSAAAGLARSLPRYDETHRGLWALAQFSALAGLSSTLGHRNRVNLEWQTWTAPAGLTDGTSIRQLILDMPALMASLMRSPLVAYGHNDIVADNCFESTADHSTVGLFDWQQACVNHVGQEWAWNFQWLPPEFLTAHEDLLIGMILKTYESGGQSVCREEWSRFTLWFTLLARDPLMVSVGA